MESILNCFIMIVSFYLRLYYYFLNVYNSTRTNYLVLRWSQRASIWAHDVAIWGEARIFEAIFLKNGKIGQDRFLILSLEQSKWPQKHSHCFWLCLTFYFWANGTRISKKYRDQIFCRRPGTCWEPWKIRNVLKDYCYQPICTSRHLTNCR